MFHESGESRVYGKWSEIVSTLVVSGSKICDKRTINKSIKTLPILSADQMGTVTSNHKQRGQNQNNFVLFFLNRCFRQMLYIAIIY